MKKFLIFFPLILSVVIKAYAKDYIFYSLQLATFKEKSRANSFFSKLQQQQHLFNNNLKIFLYETDKGLFTIRVGLERDKNKLKPIIELLKRKGFIDVIIVPTDIRKLNTQKKGKKYLQEGESRKKVVFIERIISKLNNEIEKFISYEWSLKKERGNDIFFELKQEKEKLLDKKGLYVVGEGEIRSRQVFSDEYSPIRWRAYIGIEFDFLREGIGEKEREENLLILEEFKRKFLTTSISNIYILKEQTKILNQYYLCELKKIYNLKLEVISSFEHILKELIKLDRMYIIHIKLLDLEEDIVSKQVKNLETIEEMREPLPIIDINLNKLNEVIKMKKQNFNEDIKKLTKHIWEGNDIFDVFNDGQLKLFLRHNLINVDTTRDFFSLGFRFKIPFPSEYYRRKKIYKLELKFFEQETTGKFYGVINDVLDYAIRLKQNSLHIRKHISEIRKNLLILNRDFLLWQMDIKTPDYGHMYEKSMDILNRLENILNYKIINYIYAIKIIYLLNLSENEIKEVFYGGF
ncbi:SPOR domain-containing protein [Aquifex sp.]